MSASAAQPPACLVRLRVGLEQGGFETDDTLALLLPLFRQVAAAHERALVAPLRQLHALTEDESGAFTFDDAALSPPRRHDAAINALLAPASHTAEIVGESHRTTDLSAGRETATHLDVATDADAPLTRPAYLPGYETWEHRLGHHDPVTDILSLGLLLASFACGLDFTDADEVERFARHRQNLFSLAPRLHPVLARVIGQMTELNRHRRAQDLGQLTRCLETYREQPLDLDVTRLVDAKTRGAAGPTNRRTRIQEHLRDRLFEISRRNRLLHFKPTQQMLNLTVASVPLVMDVRNIRLNQLFLWHPALAADLIAGKRIALGTYLRLEDAPYIPGVLDKIIAAARRDRAEFGFAQLRLVLCFLRWNNLKEAPDERIHSPLLLLPVELTKRKGVRDAHVLTATSSEAEINPVLRHHLKSLYGIALPETLDLQQTSLDAFHADLQQRIQASEPGVTLEKIERPRIELIHAKARQRLNQWRKRQRPRTASAGPVTVAHSYDRDDYRPRGLQLFLEVIQPRPCPLAALTGAPPAPRVPHLAAPASAPATEPAIAPAAADDPVLETSSEFYVLREAEAANPYHWAFDLCSLTLGNFHYRKMTLVRDYAKLVEEQPASPAFDGVFSLDPRPTDDTPPPSLPLRDQYPVIPCDSAQAAAVARARDGRSFIIQGPPGTGKSQTITNLIADYLAQGKRVLFVCEKRAAIDVVFHRLRQQGLDELCCLIHDSQADKKTFIQNLKQTYESWLAEPESDTAERLRDEALHTMAQDLAALDRFSTAMTAVTDFAGVSTRRLLHRLVETQADRPALTPAIAELLPVYRLWLEHGPLVDRLRRTLQTLGRPPIFADHPFSQLGRDLIRHARPFERLQQLLDTLEPRLDALESNLELSGLDEALWTSFPEIEAILDFAHHARPLAERAQLALLDPRSPLSHALLTHQQQRDVAMRALDAARQATTHWREPLNPTDTAIALEAARKFEGSWLRLVQPAYWRLRRTLRQRHDFRAYAVEPSFTRILTQLAAEQRAAQAVADADAAFAHTFAGATPAALPPLLEALRGQAEPPLPAAAVAFRRHLIAAAGTGDGAAGLVISLADLRRDFQHLRATLADLVEAGAEHDFTGLRQVLGALRREARTLPDFLPVLHELADAPAALRYAVRQAPIPLAQFEAGMAARTLEDIYRVEVALPRFDGRHLAAHRERLAQHHRGWLKSNATVIRQQVRRLFRTHVQVSTLPAAQLTEAEKSFKKTYAAGRRELEHEFGKTMRHKSIRDLAAGATGEVVRDLKPVWLMSPLSVSDTLPLDAAAFDVVIFDEASQIPVEEAVPAVYRAGQVIVVGDEMQLPPTNFFSSAGSTSPDADDPVLDEDDEAERIEIDLEADSFLAQSARNLPSTLLAWHYRSRSENLISFSNAAFYAGNLFTIPDRQLAPAAQPVLAVDAPEQGAAHVDALLARSISFHLLAHGCYEQRRNSAEAAYIAHTVRELLRRETGHSIGIVAFSEAQQAEIERALDALGEEDAAFATRLEAEINREEDDQFCGLFIKNLENVQGDERDIILLSICYGYDREKRMLMNFGPINQRGGEKRLNVIFSRARHHMAVISSIRHHDITNDYNDGANTLRNFLHYAESLSRGDLAAARQVIENLNPLSRRALAAPGDPDAVTVQLAAALRARGHAVDTRVGQSRFRCDLAVRGATDAAYALGLLIDTATHYENHDLVDRYHTRPAILQAFGWTVLLVLTKDWYHEPAAVLERIERALRGEAPADDTTLPEPPPIASAAPTSLAPTPHAVTPAAAAAPPATAAAGPTQRLEYRADGSAKFWEIEVADTCVTVRFGRIGTQGQTQQKHHPDAATARRAAAVLVDSKLRKGYQPASA